MAANNCRMYEQKFPEKEDLVMVNVKNVTEMGAYVTLLEYNDIEGMILLSELSRKRIRSIPKLIRVGRNEVVVVVRVDEEKGYIDLSKRRVSPEEVAKCDDNYNKSKTVHSIMRHVAEVTGTDVEQLYKDFGWPLYKKYKHAHAAFKLCVDDPDTVLEGLPMTPNVRVELLKNIRRRLTPQPLKIRSDVEVTCFGYEGIDAIRDALIAGQASGDDECPVKIKLIAPPLYVITTSSLDKAKGIKALEDVIEVITTEITKRSGNITVKMAPRAVSERDERDLSNLMEELERQNQEVAGDSSRSDDDD